MEDRHPLDALNEDEARRLAAQHDGQWRVAHREEQVINEPPPPPYTLLSLMADAAARLGWPAETTAEVAQSLFEEGFITYPRTDSVRVDPQAMDAARAVIAREYGAHMVTQQTYQAPAQAQDAHEAIRPVEPDMPPEQISDPRQQSLYRLIRQRFLAALMPPALVSVVTLTLEKIDDTP